MLFTADAWPGLADGSITLTFRTWASPQARTGGQYRVTGMLLEATSVERVRAGDITDDDASRAGAPDAAAVRTRMKVTDPDQLVWRVTSRYLGADDRADTTTRRHDDPLDAAAIDELKSRLDRMDRRSGKPWTRQTLRLIERYPGIVSAALARQVGKERATFKTDVRKLKELGLTESLEVGYRLSARGDAVLRTLG